MIKYSITPIFWLLITFSLWSGPLSDTTGDPGFIVSYSPDASNDAYTDVTDDYLLLDEEDGGVTIVAAQEKSQYIVTASKEQIESLNPVNLPDLLTKLGSVTITRYGPHGNSASAAIQGLSGKRILVLINGVPVNSAQNGDFDLSSVPVSSIKEIQIISGASDTKYNYSGAMGGVINIITIEKQKPGYSVFAGISNLFYYPGFYYYGTGTGDKKFSRWYDFFDTQKVYFGFSIGNSRVTWDINSEGNRAFNHYLYKDDDDIKRRRINNEVWDGAGQTSLTINLPHYMKLIGQGRFYYCRKNVPGSMNSASPGSQIDYQGSSSLYFDADYVGHERIDTELIVHYGYNRLEWEDKERKDTHDTNTIHVINNWGFYIGPFLTLMSGGDFKFSYLTSSSVGTRQVFEGAGYITGDFSIKKRAKIIPSVKLVYYKKYPVCIPKLGAVFYLGNLFTLKSNVYRTFKMPSINDLYWPRDNFAEGNPDLKPEDGIGGDIMLHFYKKKYLTAQTVFFTSYLREAILWQTGPAGRWTPDNIGEAFHFGIEARVESDFSPYVKLMCSYTFLLTYVLSNEYSFDSDKRKSYAPMHNLTFSANFNWKSGRVVFTGHFESERFTSILNTTALSSFFTVDIDFSQDIKMVTLFLSVKNLFNNFYFLREGYPMPGGAIEAGVKIRYGLHF